VFSLSAGTYAWLRQICDAAPHAHDCLLESVELRMRSALHSSENAASPALWVRGLLSRSCRSQEQHVRSRLIKIKLDQSHNGAWIRPLAELRSECRDL